MAIYNSPVYIILFVVDRLFEINVIYLAYFPLTDCHTKECSLWKCNFKCSSCFIELFFFIEYTFTYFSVDECNNNSFVSNISSYWVLMSGPQYNS